MCTQKHIIAGKDALATGATELELGPVMLRRATSETVAHSDRQHSANIAAQPPQLLSQHSSGAAMPVDVLTVSTHPAETPVQPARSVASPAGPAEAAAATGGDVTASGAAAGALQPAPAAVAAAASADMAEEAREKRRRRVAAQLKDLQQCYLALRSKQASLELDQLPLQVNVAALHPCGAWQHVKVWCAAAL